MHMVTVVRKHQQEGRVWNGPFTNALQVVACVQQQ